MSQITSNYSWEKIPTKILVNAETGQAEVFGNGGIFGDTKLAVVGANDEWKVTNLPELTKRYNNLNGTKLTEAQVEDIFEVSGRKEFNNERAAIINKNSPESVRTSLATKQNPVPGVIDPKTGQKAGQTAPTTAPTPPEPAAGSDPNVGSSSGGAATTAAEVQSISIGNRKNYYPDPLLVYPRSRKNGNGGDFIKFDIVTYEKSGLANSQTLAAGSSALPGMEYRKSTRLAQIYLPIQSGIVEGMSVDWGGGELNPITAAFANMAFTTIAGAENGLAGMYDGFKRSGADLKKFFENTNQSDELKGFFVNYFTQQAVKTQGLLSRTLGGAINNNLELLFNGPMLRNFSFNFKLTPRDQEEAIEIRKIIRYFKMSMAPALSTAQLFLLAPNVFKISYVYTGKGDMDENHPYLNRIKVAALRDISVNYTPDGNYMTYQDGSMTQYDISLSFGEIDPIYENDYLLNEGLTGTGW